MDAKMRGGGDPPLGARLLLSLHLNKLRRFNRKTPWATILSKYVMVVSVHSGLTDSNRPWCDGALLLAPLSASDAPGIMNRRRGCLYGSAGRQFFTSPLHGSGSLLHNSAAISREAAAISCAFAPAGPNRPYLSFVKVFRRTFALSATGSTSLGAVEEAVDVPDCLAEPSPSANHKDRVAVLAAEALESYLRKRKGLQLKDAEFISRNCPTFIAKMVSANLSGWTAEQHGPVEDMVHFEHWLMSSETNELEPFLLSIGLDPERLEEVLPFVQVPLDGEQGLLKSVEILEGMGIPRGRMWDVLEHNRQLLAMAPADLKSTVDFLEGLGVKRSKDMVRLIQDSFFLTDSLATLQTLKEIGVPKQTLSKAEAAQSLKLFPRLLHLRLDNLRRKIQFFDSIGLERDRVAKIISRWPLVFGLSMEKRLRPKIEMLQTLGVGREGIAKILTRYPELTGVSLEGNLKQKVAFFEENGLRGKRLVKLMTSHPRALTLSVNELNNKLDFLVLKGFSPGSVEMVRALGVCITISVESMAARFVNLESLGFSPSEGREVIKHQPAILSLSEKCIQDKVHYLLNDMHRPIEEIVKCPSYLLYSLELRIKPRHRVLSLLKSQGVLREEAYSLNTIMIMSEKRFMERFVISLGAQFPQVAAAYYSRG